MNRKKIGIRFTYHSDWTGGVYYASNLVNALFRIESDKRPLITVFCKSDELEIAREIFFHSGIKFFLLDRKLNLIQRALNKISRSIFHKEIFTLFPEAGSVDFVFPNPENYYFKGLRRIFWIPDFQEIHLPYFFSNEEKTLRNNSHKRIAENNYPVVLSSSFCEQDFKKMFPLSKSKTFVLHFAVTHPDYKKINIEELKQKYDLPDQWLITPNQFWIHKNHELIIEAVSILIKSNSKLKILFTGKEYDYRDPDFTHRLKQKVKMLNLESHISFLGFIDRKEQLQLMNHALCVIQPSLSEGWSTVIEDAKAMSQTILASNIEVHREQLTEWEGSKLFFEKDSPHDLADKIDWVINGTIKRKFVEYDSSVMKFASQFLKLADLT